MTAMGDDGAGSENDGTPDTTESTDGTTNGTAAFLFLLGLVGFCGSVVAFLADLLTGYDILRSLLVNAASAALLVWWAATDTLTDPESSVDSRGGAAGTGLLLLGLYLALGAAVVGVTSLVHDRFDIVPWAAGLGILLVVVGFVVLPRETILTADDDDESATTTGEESDS
jgi:protein-S-isoprenylcysteine O-methyltransferase Ste14